jgi:PAS domain S-box-containing protein
MKNYSIRQYVAWLTLTPLLIITVSLESFFLQDNFSDLDSNLIERGQLVARQFASSSEYGVFANNQAFLQNIAQGVLQQPDVHGVIILDATSGVLVEAGDFFGAPKNAVIGANTARPDTGQPRAGRVGKIKDLVSLQMPIYRSSEGLLIYQPIVPALVMLDEQNARQETQQTGAVIVEMSSARTEQHKSQMLWLTVGLTVLFLIFPFYLISQGSRKITVPIRKLSEAIQGLGDGLLETRVSVSAPVTELETLTKGINDMAAKLQREQVTLNQRTTSLIEAQRIAHLGSWEWDIASNTLQWSDEMYRIFGLAPQELKITYEAFIQAVHPEDRQSVDAKVRDALEQRGDYDIDFRILLPDGSLRYTHAQAEVHFTQDRQPFEMVGMLQDITERKLAEENVLKLSQAVEQNPNSIVITDLDANIEYVNEGFVKITGYSRAEAIGQNPRILQSGKTPQEIFRDMWGHLKRGEVWKGELTNRRKDGSEYIESVLVSPVRQDDGKVTHYLAIKEDITKFKQAEATLIEQLEELRRWHNVTSGREGRILELKHEVNELLAKTGQPPHYPSAESKDQTKK